MIEHLKQVPLNAGCSTDTGTAHAIRYASGNFGKSLQTSTFDLVYLFFLIDILRMDAAVAGTVLLISMLLDAAFNPALGHAIDRWLRKYHSYQKIILRAAPISAGLFILLFLLPALVPQASVVIVLMAATLFRAGCTLIDVPHNALLAGLTTDSRDRMRLATWRFLFSSLGNIAVLFGLAPVLMLSGSLRAAHYVALALAIAGLYTVVMIYSASGPGNGKACEAARSEDFHSLAAVADLARNTRLLQILGVCVLSAGLVAVFMRMTLFYSKTWLGNASFSSYLVGAQIGGQILGLPIWQYIASRTQKTTTAIAAQLLLAITMAAFLVTGPQTLARSLPLFFAAGLAVGGLTVMNWAIVPDTIEYTEAASGRRHEALTFGTLLFLNKLASGFAIAIVGWALARIGYDGGVAGSGKFDELLLIGMTVVPFVGALGSALILMNLRMTYGGHRALRHKTPFLRA